VLAETLLEFFCGVNAFFDQERVHGMDHCAKRFIASHQFKSLFACHNIIFVLMSAVFRMVKRQKTFSGLLRA